MNLKFIKNKKLNKDTKEPIYTNKISEEEYNKQKDDYTQKALKELSEQMKTFEKPKENKEENKKSKSAFNIINTNKKINTDIIKINNDKMMIMMIMMMIMMIMMIMMMVMMEAKAIMILI